MEIPACPEIFLPDIEENFRDEFGFVAGGNAVVDAELKSSRSAALRIQSVWITGTTPTMSFRGNAVSRGIFPSGRFYLVVVLFCHVVDSSTPLTLKA